MSTILITESPALAGWQVVLAILYPLQLALDLAALARIAWPSLKSWPGDVEVELSADRLRGGLRCGALWIDSQTTFVAQIKRLVVVQRTEQGSLIWALFAERQDGSRMRIVSADDPVHVLPLARDLHARLARREELCVRWPALAEEDRTDEVEADLPLPPILLPGGAPTWLAVHLAGAAGLWQIGTLPWFKVFPGNWHKFVLVAAAILQGLILLGNLGMLAGRRTSLSGGTTATPGPRANKHREEQIGECSKTGPNESLPPDRPCD
jgi:hypothetical protein